ncbi:/ pknB / Serine/threonine-protein kinase pknB /:214119 Forward [Candidatus Hepatoplasma crinochetorum]|uniref:non-specific serine/threonine protein kinase n=1 Tax=Candidatus Hepatoplasma crinochetorum TaxID=295596 RepID=A0A0G7ZMC7_9MOLU|nr:/ pknB / Serine/threonine-protein kinase pknB /:214119 Forward [Candidatus Hepatoplasma crinochetorum]
MEFKPNLIINNKYKIISEIGRGASAVVYLGYDLLNKKEVALKIQNQKDEFSNMDKRFKLEANALLNLNHQNIVGTYDYFTWNNRRVIVMEYLKGKTLEKYIREKEYLDSKEVSKYAIEILKALDHVHQNGIMHRDLKPANITITDDNKLKLMDFGIIQTSINQELTRQASIIGTIQYLAPEIFKGEKSSPPSEMFSIGVLLYRMSTGVLPFKGTSHEDTAKKILNDEPLPPTKINQSLDQELENIILKLLEKDYYNRYQTAQETINAIDNYLKNKEKYKILQSVQVSKDKKILQKNNIEILQSNQKEQKKKAIEIKLVKYLLFFIVFVLVIFLLLIPIFI